MTPLHEYTNLYTKDGKLIHKAPLKWTIAELEEYIDTLPEGRERDNCTWILFQMYQKYGNPHEAELIEKLNEYAKEHTKEKTEVVNKLNELNETVEEPKNESTTSAIEKAAETVMDEYVDFEEVNDEGRNEESGDA